jgi:Ca2+-dependent lipid-binding protein
MDFNDHRADTMLGSASFGLEVLEQDATQEDITRPILKDGHDRGELRFDVNFFPVISLSKTSEGAVQKLPDTSKFLDVSPQTALRIFLQTLA